MIKFLKYDEWGVSVGVVYLYIFITNNFDSKIIIKKEGETCILYY